MQRLIIPVQKVDAVDGGETIAVTAVAAPLASIPAAGGWFILAAEDQPIKWRADADPAQGVGVATGAFLAAGDQVGIFFRAGQDLRVILADNSTADGQVNLTVLNQYVVSGTDPRTAGA